MEGRRRQIDELVARLRRRGAKLMGLELGEPMPAGRVELIAELEGATPPPALADLYREIDGAALMWNVRDDVGELAGGFNLQESRVALLRGGAESDSEPLEGVLWTGDEEPRRLALLKRMAIFDSVPGRNDFMTFLVDDPTRLYLMADGDARRVYPALDEVLDALIEYGGADSLRAHLTRRDWRDRIARDPELERVRRL